MNNLDKIPKAPELLTLAWGHLLLFSALPTEKGMEWAPNEPKFGQIEKTEHLLIAVSHQCQLISQKQLTGNVI